MDPALRDLLTHPVAHLPRIGSDAYDKPVYGAAVPYYANLVMEARELRVRSAADGDSRVVVTRGYLILGEEAAAVAERDSFSLNALDGDVVDVVAVSKPDDIDGTLSHVRADFV